MQKKYIKLAEFDCDSDLHFLDQELNSMKIETKITDSKSYVNSRVINVKEEDSKQAKRILKKLGYKETNKSYANANNQSTDYNYTEDYIEWTENQYSPGHYTGGKYPVYHKSFTRFNFLNLLLFALGLVGFLISIFTFLSEGFRINGLYERIFMLLASIAFIIGGARNYLKKNVKR